MSEVGNNQYQLDLNLSQNPSGTCSCSCNTNDPNIISALVYNSSQVNVKPVVQGNYPHGSRRPDSDFCHRRADLRRPGPVTKTFSDFSVAPGTPITLGVQVANAVSQTRRYGWSLQLTINYADGVGTVSTTLSGSALVVAQDQSAVAGLVLRHDRPTDPRRR